jgi:hypothetical protein
MVVRLLVNEAREDTFQNYGFPMNPSADLGETVSL